MHQSPDEIRSQITRTRASLDRQLDRLAARLDPRVRIGPEPLKRVGAMAAVATGVVMLIRNVRTLRQRQVVRRRRVIPVL
jgi:Protein of unknown function (DUF3618)